MLRVNKKVEYGILALLYLADKENKSASVREIASSASIPETLLSKIMQTLKTNGYVSAVYGNQGGYHLVKTLPQINLFDLSQNLAGPIQVAECLDAGNHSCPAKSTCKIVVPMGKLNQKIIDLFQSTSLASLIDENEIGKKEAV